MFDIGFSELILIGLVALVVVGPERLPKVARTAGHLLGRLQRYVSDVKSDIQREMQVADLKKLQTEMQESARELQSSVQAQVSDVKSALAESSADARSSIAELETQLASTRDSMRTPAAEEVQSAFEQAAAGEDKPAQSKPAAEPSRPDPQLELGLGTDAEKSGKSA